MTTQQKMLAKLTASLADPEFQEGFQWGQEASQGESTEEPISESAMLDYIRNEFDPATFRREALLDAYMGARPLSLRHRYGFIAGFILATYTDVDAFTVEPDRPTLTLVASRS